MVNKLITMASLYTSKTKIKVKITRETNSINITVNITKLMIQVIILWCSSVAKAIQRKKP